MPVLQKIQFMRDLGDDGLGFLLYGLVEMSDGSGYKLEVREERYNARGDNTYFDRQNRIYIDPDEAQSEYQARVERALADGWRA